jgi:hypothetical protein
MSTWCPLFVRDTVQKVLVGRPGLEGTGAIPKNALAELVSARGIPDLLAITMASLRSARRAAR